MDRRLLAVALATLAVLAGCTTALPEATPGGGTGGGGGDATVAPGADLTPTSGGSVTVTVTRVVDGDTMKVTFENGTEDTVRLLGVDTPEVHSENSPDEFAGVPETDEGRECLRRYGERASSFAKETLEGETVTLQFDPDSDRRGYYGRLLGYLVLDGQNFNYRLVAEGHARVYDSSFSLKEGFYDAEASAQSSGTGLWLCAEGGTGPTATVSATPDGGSTDGRVAVVAVNADAEGNDNENLNEEYVTLANRGNETLDLSGWTVTDEAGKTYTFGNVTLEPDALVTLHSGSGEDTATDVYWGQSSAVWNNGGDTVTVRDPAGDVVAERSY
jgi:micrococcal nuclease